MVAITIGWFMCIYIHSNILYVYIYMCVMAFLDIRLLDSYLVSLKYPPWLQGDSCSIASIDSSLVGGLVVDLPVWKIGKSVWIIISKIWKTKSCSKNHQPDPEWMGRMKNYEHRWYNNPWASLRYEIQLVLLFKYLCCKKHCITIRYTI